MSSWNVLIGEGISLEGFREVVEPILVDQNFSVKDRVIVKPARDQRVLTSIVGESDLVRALPPLLEGIYRTLEAQQQRSMKDVKVYTFQAKYSEFLGVYSSDDAASRLFPLMAQKYLCSEVGDDIKKLEKELDALAKRLAK